MLARIPRSHDRIHVGISRFCCSTPTASEVTGLSVQKRRHISEINANGYVSRRSRNVPTVKIYGFITEWERLQHFSDHCDEFGGAFRTPEEYQAGAIAFLSRPLVGSMLESRRAKDGWILRINLETDEFAICDDSGGLRTYYKPNPFLHGKGDNLRYFQRRCAQ